MTVPSHEPESEISIPSSPAPSPANEANRTNSIATRLTEAEFTEVESAAVSAGKKVGEWLRDAVLAQARREGEKPD